MSKTSTLEEKANAVEEVGVNSTQPKKGPSRPIKKPQQPPPFKVLLHNDNVNTMDHVVRTIIQLTTLNMEEAIERTLEAHERGVALLLVTHRERAELFAEQFASTGLTVTIEPT